MNIRQASERGIANFGWLYSRHTFSFGHYFDSKYMGHGPLRVINEDKMSRAAGFPTHGHADMEIISYVISGALEHEDSEGNSSIIRPGEVQKMSAGRGIRHSEYNASKSEDVHFLQIWIEPDKKGGDSGYQQKAFAGLQKADGRLTLLLSPDGKDDSISIQQRAWVYGAKLEESDSLNHELQHNHIGWLQVVKGELLVNGHKVAQGDGIAFSSGESISLEQAKKAEMLLFDMVQH